MRGKRTGHHHITVAIRNIPAHAGKTGWFLSLAPVMREHPRACGENEPSTPSNSRPSGTSPRMRGKPFVTVDGVPRNRNIPAHAGKTHGLLQIFFQDGEHPRACGENSCQVNIPIGNVGTSPRMRGKRCTWFSLSGPFRNIPAHAGKTDRVGG